MEYKNRPLEQFVCCIVTAAAILFGGLPVVADSPSAIPLHCRGMVVNPDGTPASDATISLYHVAYPPHLAATTQKQVGSDGAFDFEIPASQSAGFDVLYAEGLKGLAVCGPSTHLLTVTLRPGTNVRIRLVDDAGLPIPNIQISPRYLQAKSGSGPGQWDGVISEKWTVKTNGDGTAVLPGLPSNYFMAITIDGTQYVQPGNETSFWVSADTAMPLHTIRLAKAGEVTGSIVFGKSDKPAAGVNVFASAMGGAFGLAGVVTDQAGHYRFSGLMPGRYEFVAAPSKPLDADWTAIARQVTVAAGVSTNNADLSLIPCAIVKGKVTEVRSGQPLPNILVYSTDPSRPADVHSTFGTQTGPDGMYALYVAPGNVTVRLDGDAFRPHETLVKKLRVAASETAALDFQITAPGPWPIQGIVVDSGGKPVAGAHVRANAPDQQVENYDATTDAQGHFSFPTPGLTPAYSLYVSADSLVMASPVKINGPDALTLHVVPGLTCSFQGNVTLDDGSPAANASVTLFRSVKDSGESVSDTTTDAAGFFRFRTKYDKAAYSVDVKKAGYGNQISKEVPAVQGGITTFAVRLVKADSFLGGTVVDRYGKPIAGADVQAMDIDHLHTITDALGRFHLAGIPEDRALVRVTASEDRRVSYIFEPGQDDVIIYALSVAEGAASGAQMRAIQASDANLHGNGKDATLLLGAAEGLAAASGKKVLLVFGASWCPGCYCLSRFLEKPEVKSILEAHFIVLELDIMESNKKGWENPGGVAIYKKYGGTNTVPFWVFLDASGIDEGDSKIDGQNMGLSTIHRIRERFLHLMKVNAPNITDSDLQTLRQLLLHIDDD